MKRFQVTAAVAIVAVAGMASKPSTDSTRLLVGLHTYSSTERLLQNEAVQTELKLTGEQKKMIQAALRREGGGVIRLPERLKMLEETITTVLDEKQQHRLVELVLQDRGIEAIDDREVAKNLGLKQAQKDQLEKIYAANPPNTRFNYRNANGAEIQKHLKEVRERREKINIARLAVLTPAQKEAFEKMQGEKFTFPPRGGNRNP